VQGIAFEHLLGELDEDEESRDEGERGEEDETFLAAHPADQKANRTS
jgi:hypothetical protein